jgi:hypothetical protein
MKRPERAVGKPDFERHIPADGGHPPGETGRFGACLHQFPLPAREFSGVGDHALDVAVGMQQLEGGFFPDAGNAGDIVGAVAHESLQVGNLFGGQAVPLTQQGLVIFLV